LRNKAGVAKTIEANQILWCFDVDTVERQGFDLGRAVSEIAEAFLHEPHLLKVSPQDFRLSFLENLSVIGFTPDGRVVCHARLIHLVSTWFELGGTYVHPDYRGRKINHEMYRVFLPRHAEKDILATTTNPISRAVGQYLGFTEIPRRLLPEKVWRASCSCPIEKIGTFDQAVCPLAFSESARQTDLCYFRVTPETARRHGLSGKAFSPEEVLHHIDR